MSEADYSPVDEFDSGVRPITDAEAVELFTYCRSRQSQLAAEVTGIEESRFLDGYRYLLMTIFDDMRRVKAGKPSRYGAF